MGVNLFHLIWHFPKPDDIRTRRRLTAGRTYIPGIHDYRRCPAMIASCAECTLKCPMHVHDPLHSRFFVQVIHVLGNQNNFARKFCLKASKRKMCVVGGLLLPPERGVRCKSPLQALDRAQNLQAWPHPRSGAAPKGRLPRGMCQDRFLRICQRLSKLRSFPFWAYRVLASDCGGLGQRAFYRAPPPHATIQSELPCYAGPGQSFEFVSGLSWCEQAGSTPLHPVSPLNTRGLP